MTAPPPPHPEPPSPPRRGVRPLLLGLLVGLVVGAGAVGLAWALSGSDGVEADAEAMCGIVERTPPLSEDISQLEVRRWAVVEVAPSLAEADPRYQPLADTFADAINAFRAELDVERAQELVDRALRLCEEL